MIIENLIPVGKQDEIEKIFTSDIFPWYFNETTVNGNYNTGECKKNPLGKGFVNF